MFALKLDARKKAKEYDEDSEMEDSESSEAEGSAGKMAAEKLASLLKADAPDGQAILDQMKTCMEYAQGD